MRIELIALVGLWRKCWRKRDSYGWSIFSFCSSIFRKVLSTEIPRAQCPTTCGTLKSMYLIRVIQDVVHLIFFTSNADSTLSSLKPDGCNHHHKNKKNFVGKGKAAEGLKSLLSSRTYAYLMEANLL